MTDKLTKIEFVRLEILKALIASPRDCRDDKTKVHSYQAKVMADRILGLPNDR